PPGPPRAPPRAAPPADPATPLADLPLLTAAESHHLAAEWSGAGTLAPAPSTIPALLAAQAARTPDAVAVTAGDDRLPYRELHRQAANLAAHLHRLDLAPEARVAVLL